MKVIGDQCRYGLVSCDGERVGPARKRIGFMTNSPCIATALMKKCPNAKSKVVHKHVRLESGRAKVAQIYPQSCARRFVEDSKNNSRQTEMDASCWQNLETRELVTDVA